MKEKGIVVNVRTGEVKEGEREFPNFPAPSFPSKHRDLAKEIDEIKSEIYMIKNKLGMVSK